MTKKKKVIITVLAALLLLAGARYAQKSYQKHQVFSNGDFCPPKKRYTVCPSSGKRRKPIMACGLWCPIWIGTLRIRRQSDAFWKPTTCMPIITS